MKRVIKIGTRESELAVWQAKLVQSQLQDSGYASSLVMVTSEGDLDQVTPLYEMGVQGIFTKSLDGALLNNKIDIAVHSMKDVPTMLPAGIVQAAVLKRGNHHDLFIINEQANIEERAASIENFHQSLSIAEAIHFDEGTSDAFSIATSSVRRKAQWLHRYPKHNVVNLRGNINTRLQKIKESNWQGAILATAGLERINLRPKSGIELSWMLPAPAQGAIMVVCNESDAEMLQACKALNHPETMLCTQIEKDFLRALLGGCSTPIGALAVPDKKEIFFKGNILTLDGKEKIEVEKYVSMNDLDNFGNRMAEQLLKNGGREIAEKIQDGK
ncbi:MAG: hydroxymethylbilane synthase [Ferruginibacter sp.]